MVKTYNSSTIELPIGVPFMSRVGLGLRLILACLFACLLVSVSAFAAQQDQAKDQSQKDQSNSIGTPDQPTAAPASSQDPLVRPLSTKQKKQAFMQLSNDEERDHFIEAFWQRRDPTPDTPENEFKDEHYRRIAYAND